MDKNNKFLDEFFKIEKEVEANFFDNRLFNYFIQNCWRFEEQQKKCFSILEEHCKKLPATQKIVAIPRLIEESKNFNNLVFLANDLFKTLETSDKEKIKIPYIGWTRDDSYTVISNEELEFRKRYKLPFDIKDNTPTRPSCARDLECYYLWLSMSFDAKTEVDIYMIGY